MLRGDTQLLVVVCRYTGVRWSTAWLETGEDACRWTVRWREGELGTRAYDHAAVKDGRAGATDAGEAVASTPGTELEGRVVGDGSVVVPARAGVLGTCSLARGGGTRVEACWFGG